MSVFPDWEQYAVHQRRQSGCVPTGLEMLLRAAEVESINYATFQDDFDFDKESGSNNPPKNNFESVTNAVQCKYPHVRFEHITFPHGSGIDKLKFIEERIAAQQPVLISLSLAPYLRSGWHIMLVVDATENELTLLNNMDAEGKKHLHKLTKSDLVRIHDEFKGGDDICYLASVQPSTNYK